MKNFRLLLMMVLAAVVAFTACEPNGGEDKVVAPAATVTLDAASVTASSFTAFVATTNAQKAAWVVTENAEEAVTAESVFANGTEIPAENLNGEEPAAVVVEGLKPQTTYFFFVAMENKGKTAVCEPVEVTTSAAAPSFSKVIEFLPTSCAATNLVEAGVGVGHWLTLMDENYNMMQIVIQDSSQDAMSYKFLAGQTYPAATGNVMGGQMPTGSAVVCDPSLSNLCVYDEATDTETTYYFVGEKGNDADDVPYGVDIITVMPEQDNNMITFNLVATCLDSEGNPVGEEVLIVGQYTGPFGYPMAAAAIEFDLNEWRFTSFKATAEGNTVTLLSNSTSGDFKIILDTTSYNGQVASAEGNLYVVGDNLSGYYFDPLDFADYNFTEGGFMLYPGDKEGEYKLEVGERRGWKMAGGSKQFNIVPGVYTIQIEGLQSGNEVEDLPRDTADGEF